MPDIKVKYCGLRTLADVEAAAAAGVNAVGFVLVEKSPRYVTIEQAQGLIRAAQKHGLTAVVLFADHDATFVQHVIDQCQPDVLQFHGHESAAFCQQFKHRYWKAVPMLSTEDYIHFMASYNDAEAFLLDTYGGQQIGGSGHAFEWFTFPVKLRDQLILAGGLNASNVAQAVALTGTHFIDISSGIEATKGVKSEKKMLSLMQHIRAINQNDDQQPITHD